MHIVIDARLYGPLGKGLGRYIERLIENLEVIDTENRYSVLLSRENFHLFTPRSDRWTKICVPVRWYTLREQFVIPWVLWRLKPDLVHFPHFNAPFLYRRPFVVTIHDLILLKHPSTRSSMLNALCYWLKYLGYRLILRHALAHAAHIITVSNTVRNEIVEKFNFRTLSAPYRALALVLGFQRFNLRKSRDFRISTTYEASDGVESGQLKMPDANWLMTRGITKPYLLYVGNAYPHKNLDFLITWFLTWQKNNYSISKVAAPQFPRSLPLNFKFPNYQLILVGTEDYFYKKLKEKVSQFPSFPVSQTIIFFGYATESELADLYRHARLVVYPSLEEGFGLPPLEAMRYDVPVVVSDLPVLHEILGDAATYFDPKSEASLTRAIISLLPSVIPSGVEGSTADGSRRLQPAQGTRSKKIQLGRLQVSKYSWHRMAEETHQIYVRTYERKN